MGKQHKRKFLDEIDRCKHKMETLKFRSDANLVVEFNKTIEELTSLLVKEESF